jgi:glycosyltransferase involved in cell wall biosynthesis
MTQQYRSFPGGNRALPARLPSLCIVTNELVGPFKNGGIGTSMTGFAECMVAAGFSVTILYSGGNILTGTARDHWQKKYAEIGITLLWLQRENTSQLQGPLVDQGFAAPYMIYQVLRNSHYDVIQFNDCLGEGFYCLAMKRLGMAFQDSYITVGLHSPAQWVFQINRMLPQHSLASAFNFAEQVSTRCADLLWSPSHYLLDWIQAHEFTIPDATYVQQYAIPTAGLFANLGVSVSAGSDTERQKVIPKEIVFFGRIEERKGIRLFCAMLHALNRELAEHSIAITFMGKPSQVGSVNATDYLRDQASAWQFDWKIVSDLGQQEALAYLRRHQPLMVMPSPADNSPCTVYEALSFELPFVAARTGGIPELVLSDDHDAVLFDYNVSSLTAKIGEILKDGIAPARPAFSQAELKQRWINAFSDLAPLITPQNFEREAERMLSAIIEHDTGNDLERVVASLPTAQRIAVINRCATPMMDHPDPRIDIINMADAPCAMLQSWIEAVSDHWLLLLESGVSVCPDGADQLAHALQFRGIDGLMPAGLGAGGKIVPPLGGGQSYCYFQGALHAGGIAIKADRLLARMTSAQMFEQGEFFGLADIVVAANLDILPFAEPVLLVPTPRHAPVQSPERIALYAQATPCERYYIMGISSAAATLSGPVSGRLRAIRDFLHRMHAGWLIRVGKRVIPRRILQFILLRG